MIRPIQLIRQKVANWRLKLFRLLAGHFPWMRRDDGSMRREVTTIIDLLTTILKIRNKQHISAKDVDAALDILRYTFPEVEHSWLARKFEGSMRLDYSLSDVLAAAAAGRDEPERMALALEILSLLNNSGDRSSLNNLFERITYGLELPGAALGLMKLLNEPGTEAEEPAFSVSFSSTGKGEVDLPEVDKGVEFRLVRCSHLVMVINDGTTTLIVRGRPLTTGKSRPLTSGQVVVAPSGPISYEDFSFFLEAKRTGKKEVFFFSVQEGSLHITRTRNRSSQLKVMLGLRVQVIILRQDVELKVNGKRIETDSIIELGYQDPFMLQGEGPFYLDALKEANSGLGKQFQIDSATRRVRVTNLPGKARKGDLLMTPGLASGVVFEVSFSSDSASGMIEIIEESGQHISVNQRVVRKKMALKDGDMIRLNAYQSLRCNFSSGVLDEEYNAIRSLSVEGLTKEFPRSGRVVDNVDFEVKRGEMVCILGPSGCGKSTLLAILAGHLPPTRGRIRYNGQQLYEQPSILRPYIAFIPREDILDASMSVAEHIAQASIVRRPRLQWTERMRRVNAILKFLGLTNIASRRVGGEHERVISDGERTRLNLGLDLTGVSDVFLMDEPISGLSSSDALKVVETLERLRRDKLVIVTMHRPSTNILNRFDKALVLDHGGQMAFWGTPVSMVRYFRKAATDMGIQVSADSQNAGGADFVMEVLEAPLRWHDRRRLQHPRLWQERFEGARYRATKGRTPSLNYISAPTKTIINAQDQIPPQPKRSLMQLWCLFRLWVMRTFLGRVRSRMGLYSTLLEGPLLGVLIAVMLRASSTPEFSFGSALHIPPYLFLSAVVAMFFGLTGAASEILKDNPVLKRESNYRVFVTGYIIAKALVLTFLAAVQSALYLVVANEILQIYEMFVQYWLVMVLTAFVGVSISLLISVFAKTERVALNMVPLVLVPQVLLAGAMIPFEEMNQFIPWFEHRTDENGRLKPGRVPLVAELCPLRYSYEMFVVAQATENLWEIERLKIQKQVDILKAKPGMLTPTERDKMHLLLSGLTAISSLEAPDADTAKYYVRTIRRLATGQSIDELTDFVKKLEKIKKQTIVSFYVNDRVQGIFEYAEAQRQSREAVDRPSIFLAKLQPLPFMGDGKLPDDPGYSADHGSIPTLWKDYMILMIMGIVPLVISGFFVKRRLEVRARHARL